MNQYASTNMDLDDKLKMHKKITNHYLKMCKELLKEHLDIKMAKLVQIETNIWGCIYRMKDKSASTCVLDDDSE
jgi:predicted transcriptional regulator